MFQRLISLVIIGSFCFGFVCDVAASEPDYHPNGWAWPAGTSETGNYAPWRPSYYPVHVGQDFKLNAGEVVYAIGKGVIVENNPELRGFRDWSDYSKTGSAFLLKCKTRTGRIFYALYGHSYLDSKFQVGDVVDAGEPIGRVHDFVDEDGDRIDHLHLGIHPDKKPSIWSAGRSEVGNDNGWVNPMKFMDNHIKGSDLFLPEEAGFTNLESLMFFTDCMETDLCGKDDLKKIVDQPFVDQLCNGNATIGDKQRALDYIRRILGDDYCYHASDLRSVSAEPVASGLQEPNRQVMETCTPLIIPDLYDLNEPFTPVSTTGNLRSLFKYIRISKYGKERWDNETKLAPGEHFDVKVKFYEYEGRREIKGDIKFYLSDDKHFDKNEDTYIGKDKFKVKPGEEEKEYCRKVDVPEKSGNYYVFCRVKWEGNKYYVKEYAKLRVEYPELSPSDFHIARPDGSIVRENGVTIKVNEPTTIRYSVTNTGFDVADNVGVAFYLTQGEFTQRLGNYPTIHNATLARNDLDEGETASATFGFGLPPNPGNYTIAILIDPDKHVKGDVHPNNARSISFTLEGTQPSTGIDTTNPALSKVKRVPVYRFFTTHSYSHFYTINTRERDALNAPTSGWRPEGIGFYAYGEQIPGSLPVHRFYYPGVEHFFTMSDNEKNALIAAGGWRYEGIAFYAFPKAVTGSTPVFRLYNPLVRSHFYTANAGERDNADRHCNYSYEGVGFYAFGGAN